MILGILFFRAGKAAEAQKHLEKAYVELDFDIDVLEHLRAALLSLGLTQSASALNQKIAEILASGNIKNCFVFGGSHSRFSFG